MLEKIKSPNDVKNLTIEELEILSQDIRTEIIKTVTLNGGHIGPSLGAVELIVSLHKVFNTPKDIIIYDVSHQTYAHKLITGRFNNFKSIRTYKGLSGFTNKHESEYDHFTMGHAGPSISVALGIKEAFKQKNQNNKVIAVIGDGSFSSGISFEGLNNAGMSKNDLIIILNDNGMSISKNVGALSNWLSRAMIGTTYQTFKNSLKSFLKGTGKAGEHFLNMAHKFAESARILFTPGTLFEGMGFQYIGPIDGHNYEELIETFEDAKSINKPIVIHILTKKGKGYKPSEENPAKYHGISPKNKNTDKTWTDIYSETIVELAGKYKDIVAITAAMPNGTGLEKFYNYFPERFYDVGIAEQHAVSFASGLAYKGMKPFVSIYSTFLQRSFDQIFHEVSLQKLDVVFMVDRAGLVGEDGATHHGVFDLSYLRIFPDMIVMTPRDEYEFKNMIFTAYNYKSGPIAVRYPRGSAVLKKHIKYENIQIGSFEVLSDFGTDYLIIATGWTNLIAQKVCEKFNKENKKGVVINGRFIKPIDGNTLKKYFKKITKVITIEENTIVGGFASAVMEWQALNGFNNKILPISIPDKYIEHGNYEELRNLVGLNESTIYKKIKEFLIA